MVILPCLPSKVNQTVGIANRIAAPAEQTDAETIVSD
jgi:hypothetical protein